jgi:hypothetical protein
MTDIVERLRFLASGQDDVHSTAISEAADIIERLRTVMVAAAEEIAAHWDAHCDAEGYGPANLQRRLEEGIPSQYGYTAGAFAELKAENERLRALAAPSVPSEPVAWIEGPHGTIRMNLLWKLDPMPPQSVAWSIPLYTPQPAPAGWRPIETAPEREWVLLAIEGRWVTTGDKWPGFGWTWEETEDEPADARPTHWHPIPAAPAAPGE